MSNLPEAVSFLPQITAAYFFIDRVVSWGGAAASPENGRLLWKIGSGIFLSKS